MSDDILVETRVGLFRRRLVVRRDEIQLGSRVIPVASISGLDGACLKSSAGKIPIARCWDVIAEHILPQIAKRIAESLLAGHTVRMGPATLKRDGFTIRDVRAAWSELLPAETRPEGLLIALVDRPQDAIVLKQFADLPIFMLVGKQMVAAGAGSKTDIGWRPLATPPLKGLPKHHPELGEIIFTRRIGFRTHLSRFVGVLGVCGLLLGIGGCLVSGEKILGNAGVVVAVVALTALGLLNAPGGDAFVAYDKGVANLKKSLKWIDVQSIQLDATEHYITRFGSRQYQYTAYSIALSGPNDVKFAMTGYGPETEAFYNWFTSSVVGLLAAREFEIVREGKMTTLAGVTVDAKGLKWTGGALSWDDYQSTEPRDGKLHVFSKGAKSAVHREEMSAPNAHILLRVLKSCEAGRS